MNGGDVLLILFQLMLGNLPMVAADAMLVVGCVMIAPSGGLVCPSTKSRTTSRSVTIPTGRRLSTMTTLLARLASMVVSASSSGALAGRRGKLLSIKVSTVFR